MFNESADRGFLSVDGAVTKKADQFKLADFCLDDGTATLRASIFWSMPDCAVEICCHCFFTNRGSGKSCPALLGKKSYPLCVTKLI